jgi:uncharacterized membrane protein
LISKLRRPTRSEAALGGVIVAFTWWFGVRCWYHQRYFGNFSFDLGIYDQGVWLLSRGDDPFVTVRGLELFGHHTNFILLLWAPFYRLFGAGAGFLAVSEVVIVGLAAIPVYLLTRDRLQARGDDRAGLLAFVLAAAFLLNPALENQLWWTFHPDTIAVLPVLCTWLFATRGRWRAATFWGVVALLCKEDVALTLAAMALVLAWRERDRRLVVPALGSMVWFLFMTRGVMTALNNGLDPFYVSDFSHLGANVREMAVNSVIHPSRWLYRVDEGTAADGRYWFVLSAPFGILPLLAGPEVLMILPQFLVNSVTLWPYATDARYHYSAMPVAALAICTVELVGRLPGRSWRRGVVAAALAGALVTNIWWAPSPLGAYGDVLPGIDTLHRGDPVIGAFRRTPHIHQRAAEAAMDLIPADASVSAVFYLVPQLTHRREIYEFPTPFMRFNYREPGERPPDPATIDYVIVDAHAWYDPSHEQLFDVLLQPGSGFEVVFMSDDIVLLHRTADPLSPAVLAYRDVGL